MLKQLRNDPKYLNKNSTIAPWPLYLPKKKALRHFVVEIILVDLNVTKNDPQKLVQYLVPVLRQINKFTTSSSIQLAPEEFLKVFFDLNFFPPHSGPIIPDENLPQENRKANVIVEVVKSKQTF